MARVNRKESPTGIYHVMQRGVGKQIIFEDEGDYKYYLKKLVEYKNLLDIEIIAYCLMDNHVHLIIKSVSEMSVSDLFQRIGTSFANYYNMKYSHCGHVFQGRYCCELVDSESYLLACTRYIHNNPVKAGLATRESYKWSSYNEYILGNGIVNRDPVLSILGSVNQFVEFSKSKDDVDVMDCDNRKLTIKDGIKFIRERYGYDCESGSAVNRICKDERDIILRDLKKAGFTAKQIELLTGVSKNIVYKACGSTNSRFMNG